MRNIWKPFCERNKKYDQVKNKLGDERIFVYMGRIANEKNIEILKSWRQTKKDNCKLVIVGDGPMKPTLENSFSSHNKEKLIWWGPELDLETRVAIMQIAEVFFTKLSRGFVNISFRGNVYRHCMCSHRCRS